MDRAIMPGQKLVYRTYWDDDLKHVCYCDQVHDKDDCHVAQLSALELLFGAAGIEDGDEFEIVVVKTGNRPFMDRKYRYQAFCTYAPETDEQMRIRKLNATVHV